MGDLRRFKLLGKYARARGKYVLATVPLIIAAAYYFYIGDLMKSAISFVVMMFTTLVLMYINKRRAPNKIDERLVNVALHMYAVSLGQVGPKDLVDVVAHTTEYGYYYKIFRRIRYIATELGYGFTQATARVSDIVRQPFKDMLVRLITAFSSTEPKGYLEIESSTMIEEYSGIYNRGIESLKILGGVFSTFQSVAIFIIMTLAMLTVFMSTPNMIFYSYVISCITLILMFAGIKMAAPSEHLIHIGEPAPPLYRVLKWALIITTPVSVFLAALMLLRGSPAYSFFVLGGCMIVPGAFAYRLETRVFSIDEHYPTFLKSLGGNIASTTSMKLSLASILEMELGPLRGLLRRALARVKLGISNKRALALMSSESASHQIYISNRIFLDALNYGGDPLIIGKVLGNHVVQFLEFRKRRKTVAKSFEAIVLIMQPITVALLVLLTFLSNYFSSTLASLPFFEFGAIPIGLLEIGNIIIVIFISILNAIALKEIGGGFWGTFFLNFGIIMMLNGATWIGTDMLIDMVFKKMMPGVGEIIPG